MRLYRVAGQGSFVEYAREPFQQEHIEETLEAWLEGNPEALLAQGKHLLIGRQVLTNLGTFIDLLGVDREGSLVVVELKRAETPRTTLAQALEYASFAAGLDYDQLEALYRTYTQDEGARLLEAHREFFQLAPEEAVAFNKRQQIVIVGSPISPQIRQTALYLREQGIPLSCVEFDYFRTASGEELLSTDLVVGLEPLPGETVSSAGRSPMTKASFFAALSAGQGLFEAVLSLEKSDGLLVHWTAKGFSLRVDLGGQLVVLAYGFAPGGMMIGEAGLYTEFSQLRRKVDQGDELAALMHSRLEKHNLWVPAGHEMKCVVSRDFSPEETAEVCRYLTDLRLAVMERGLAGAEVVEAS